MGVCICHHAFKFYIDSMSSTAVLTGPFERQRYSVGLTLGLSDGVGAFCCACHVLAAAMRHRHGDLRRAFAILAASSRALLATLVAWEQAAWREMRRAATVTASDHSTPTASPSINGALTQQLHHVSHGHTLQPPSLAS